MILILYFKLSLVVFLLYFYRKSMNFKYISANISTDFDFFLAVIKMYDVKIFTFYNYLIYTRKNPTAFTHFSISPLMEANPGDKISFSKFSRLRPPNVLSFTKIPHNLCCCQIHENFRCSLKALKKAHPSFAEINVDYGTHKNFVCAEPTESCFDSSVKFVQMQRKSSLSLRASRILLKS